MTLDNRCRDFREKLGRVLEGLPMPAELVTLSWHEHLVGCCVCRNLLEREEALELLLASLPEPNLPPDLSRRLVARLAKQDDSGQEKYGETVGASAGAVGLDELLEIAGAPVPPGLANRIRSGVRKERALDALLALDTHVDTPTALAQNVLSGLAADRRQAVSRLQLLRSKAAFAAAAGFLLAALSLGTWLNGEGESTDSLSIVQTEEVATAPSSEPDASMLAVLDIIENDSLWKDNAGGAELVSEEDDLLLLLSDFYGAPDELLLAFLGENDELPRDPSDG
ncbi:MAG: hypothetical protein ACI8X5_001224 [Planctomycetota bacterium]|jgi:hypothetical protein